MLRAAVLGVLLSSVSCFTIQAPPEKTEEPSSSSSGNTIDDDKFSVSTLIEKANKNVGKNMNEPMVLYGDIAVPEGLQNADSCVTRGCLWPKATDGKVYVPYNISTQFTRRQRETILAAFRSFSPATCIRFTPVNGQQDFLNIQSLSGCFSFVGRRGGGQTLSLSRQGCVFRQIIQHEVLHALGFNHEQTRSDRDQHVRILFQNVESGREFNFRRLNTINLGTPYDYGSVMHYGRFAFSRNRQPTIIPIPNANVAIGRATQMSPIDIQRVNILYRCENATFKPAGFE